MKLDVTDDGLKAMAETKILEMTDFVVGNALNLASMKEWVTAWLDITKTYSGPYTYYTYPVNSYHTYIKGDSYSENGKTVIVTENFLEVLGSLDCTLVSSSFFMRSMGIIAEATDPRTGTKEKFIYAYGNISSTDKPYPVNQTELITYNTPVKIFYVSSDNVQANESGVPWKNFIQHENTSVNSADGVHGLKINPNTKELTVGGTTIILSGGDERIAELEREIQGVLKYKESDTRTYNSEWVDRMEGTGTELDPYKIFTPKDFYSMRLTSQDSSKNYYRDGAYFTLENNLDFGPILGVTASLVNGVVTVTVINRDAPLFNVTVTGGNEIALGWDNINLRNNCNFNGKNHFIKNIFIGNYDGYEKWGLFSNTGTGAVVSNLNIIDSLYHSTHYYDRNGSIVAVHGGNRAIIQNCTSYATLVSSTDSSHVGGIAGDMNSARAHIFYCSFHGTIYNTTYSDRGDVGGIVGNCGGDAVGNPDRIVGCYSDVNIQFGQTRGGIVGWWGGGPKNLKNCYFAGHVTPKPIDSGAYCQSLYGGPYTGVDIANCYSLVGSAISVQGTEVTNAELLNPEMVARLNLGLPISRYSYKPGYTPRLDFEQDNIPWDSPLAIIDTEHNFVLNSGYVVRDLQNIATQQDLSMVYQTATGLVADYSKVVVFNITIQSSDWDGDRRYRIENSVFINGDSTKPVIIYDSQEMIDADIYVEYVGVGYTNLRCYTTPSTDISFIMLVIVNA